MEPKWRSKVEAVGAPQFSWSVLNPSCSKGWLSASKSHTIPRNSHWEWMLAKIFLSVRFYHTFRCTVTAVPTDLLTQVDLTSNEQRQAEPKGISIVPTQVEKDASDITPREQLWSCCLLPSSLPRAFPHLDNLQVHSFYPHCIPQVCLFPFNSRKFGGRKNGRP